MSQFPSLNGVTNCGSEGNSYQSANELNIFDLFLHKEIHEDKWLRKGLRLMVRLKAHQKLQIS